MISRSIPVGFQSVRRDRLLQEARHDTYKSRKKLPEPTLCPHCGAVFHGGRWQWGLSVPPDAHRSMCPACQRVEDHYPAGVVVLCGAFLSEHRDEIRHLVYNEAARERQGHPLKRVMAIEEKESEMLITTTDIHLARGLGEAVHHSYQGELEFHYNAEDARLRVHWQR